MANSVDPDQTAPMSSLSGSMLFASIFNSSVMLDNYLQQTISADFIFSDAFFLGALRVKNSQYNKRKVSFISIVFFNNMT